MAEFRVMLEGGNVLVVTLEVEESDAATLEPEQVGISLLKALGLAGASRPKAVRPARPPRPKTLADEENADTWLRKTSEASLGQKFSRKLRADGDEGD